MNVTSGPAPSAIDLEALEKKFDGLRTLDPDLTPEELDAILDIAIRRDWQAVTVYHRNACLWLEKATAARADFQHCCRDFTDPALDKHLQLAVVQAMGRALGRWHVAFAHPLRIALQRVLIIPEQILRTPQWRNALLEAFEEQVSKMSLRDEASFSQEAKDICHNFRIGLHRLVLAMEESPPPPDSAPPGGWKQLTSWCATPIRRLKAYWSRTMPSKHSASNPLADMH